MHHRKHSGGVRRLSLAATVAAGAVVAAGIALPAAPANAVGPGTYAYVVDGATSDVYIVDTSTGSTVATVAGGGTVTSIVVSPDGRKAFATDAESNTVLVIDTAQEAVTATIQLPGATGRGASAESLSPDGSTLYVTDSSNNLLDAVDTATNTVTNTVPIARFTVSVVATSSQVYVPDYLANSVTAYNPGTLAVTATIPVLGAPLDLAVIPNANKIYVSLDSDGVSAIDTTTNTATLVGGPTPGGAYAVAASPDGTRAYVTDGFDLYVFDTSTGTALTSLPLDSRPDDLAVGPDGRIYLNSRQGPSDDALLVLDPSTLTVVRTTAFPHTISTFSIGTTAPAPAGKADVQGKITGTLLGRTNTAYTYTVTAKDVGPGAASGVSAGLLLPPRTTLVSASGTFVQRGQLILWKAVPTLGVNASTTFQVTVKFATKGAKVLLGGVWSNTPDPKPFNNVALGGALIS